MTITIRRFAASVVAFSIAAVPGAVAAYAEDTSAPDGIASATGGSLIVAGNEIISISETEATATSTGASASASVLSLGGEPLDSTLGGTQEGEGTTSGELLDLTLPPDDPAAEDSLRVAIAPWSATVEDDGTNRTATGEARLLHVEGKMGGEEQLDLQLFHSFSQAFYDGASSPDASSSHGASDLLDLNLGGGQLHIVVLHSEADSNGEGSVYVLSVNGNEIGSDEQFDELQTALADIPIVGDPCLINIPGALCLILVNVEGGVGNIVAKGGGLIVGDPEDPSANATGGLFTTSGQAGTGTTGDGGSGGGGGGGGVGGAGSGPTTQGQPAQVQGVQAVSDALPAADAARGPSAAGALATTGLDIVRWTLIGLSLLMIGAALREGMRTRGLASGSRPS